MILNFLRCLLKKKTQLQKNLLIDSVWLDSSPDFEDSGLELGLVTFTLVLYSNHFFFRNLDVAKK